MLATGFVVLELDPVIRELQKKAERLLYNHQKHQRINNPKIYVCVTF